MQLMPTFRSSKIFIKEISTKGQGGPASTGPSLEKEGFIVFRAWLGLAILIYRAGRETWRTGWATGNLYHYGGS